MAFLTKTLKRHPLIAYFVLTYLFTWTLLIILQPFYLEGQRILAPLIALGIFGPALVSVGLSAMINPRPKQGRQKATVIAFFGGWVIGSGIILLNLIINNEMGLSIDLAIHSVITGLLPAFIVSCTFSRIPGVRSMLRTYRSPRGGFGYYLLALVLFPAFWLLGNLLSRTMGIDVPISSYSQSGVKFLGSAILFYLYNLIFGGLSEEPGWRGFALPRLQVKFSPLVSSLILGVIWAVWHAPGRFGGIEAKSLTDTIVEWVLTLFVTVIFTWLYNRTKGSVLVTALAHPAMNTTGNFLTGSLGALILLFVFILFVIVLDKMWKMLPADNPAIFQKSNQLVAESPNYDDPD